MDERCSGRRTRVDVRPVEFNRGEEMPDKPRKRKPVTRIGKGVNEIACGAFQRFEYAATWLSRRSSIPHSPGVYLLRSLDVLGHPVLEI